MDLLSAFILATLVVVALCFLGINYRHSLRRGWTKFSSTRAYAWARPVMVALLEVFLSGMKKAATEIFKEIGLAIWRGMTGMQKPSAAQGGAGGRCSDEPIVVHRGYLTRRCLLLTISDAPVLGLQRGALQIMCSLGSVLDDMFSYDILHHGILHHGILHHGILHHGILHHGISQPGSPITPSLKEAFFVMAVSYRNTSITASRTAVSSIMGLPSRRFLSQHLSLLPRRLHWLFSYHWPMCRDEVIVFCSACPRSLPKPSVMTSTHEPVFHQMTN
ncbi:hypothetical protein CaCOL14_007647 [Colletotrichum acutatum]